MVKFERVDWGILLDGKVMFGATVPCEKCINLALEKWDDVDYIELPYTLINYPGEYDIEGIFIKCFVDKKNMLNYIVSFGEKSVGIIQNAKILDRDEICDMDLWLYSEEKIANKIDQLELEWKKELIEMSV